MVAITFPPGAQDYTASKLTGVAEDRS